MYVKNTHITVNISCYQKETLSKKII